MPRFQAETYLESVLPALLRACPDRAAREAIVQILVTDLDGCEVVFRIAGASVDVRRGIADRVDLTIAILSRDLADLSEGALDVERAVRSSRLRVYGDEEVLAWLSRRLAA
jgi:ubiquinone biosynthesis protein UbiJ